MAYNHRPRDNKARWQTIAESTQDDEQRKRKVKKMVKTIAQGFYDDGFKAGFKRGELEGIQLTLISIARNRFDAPDEMAEWGIRCIENTEKLLTLAVRVLAANSWSELIKT